MFCSKVSSTFNAHMAAAIARAAKIQKIRFQFRKRTSNRSLNLAYLRYFARNATVSFHASAASSARYL